MQVHCFPVAAIHLFEPGSTEASFGLRCAALATALFLTLALFLNPALFVTAARDDV
jgi:hypothetical protein